MCSLFPVNNREHTNCVRCSLCGLHCSQCSLLNPVLLMCSLLFPVFPIFPPLCPDCSWVTCWRPPAAGPTLSTQKQSVLFTRFPVPSVFPIVSCVPSVFSIFPGFLRIPSFPVAIVLSMFRVCPLCDHHSSLCSQCVCTLCVPYVPSAFSQKTF